jgi:hypothetical protein
MRVAWTIALAILLVGPVISGCGGGPKPPGPDLGGFSDLVVDAADEAVRDKARKKATRESVEHLARVFDDYSDELWGIRTRMFYLNANYSMTEGAFESHLANLEAAHEDTQREFIEALRRVHRDMTDTEWRSFNEELESHVAEDGGKS